MTSPTAPAMPDDPDPDETIFAAALQWETPTQRAAYLDEACAGQPELRARVEALLQASNKAETFLERPVGVPRPSPDGVAETIKRGFSELLPATEGPGTKIGRYKLLQQIGEGGCGTVFMAEQEEPVRRRVALKVIKLGMDTRSVVARFEAERQALAMMDHPNIARVLDAGATDSGRPFFVMELVRGIPITRYCDENKLDTQARLDLFIKVCHAIQHAHQKGIIHRDIKPSNILVTLHDGVPVPKVIDFGIAKATEGRLTNQTLFTAFEQFIGTPAYMSPEQAEMSGLDIDTRSDIYALGVLLYELLTGKTPFDAKELVQSGIDAMRKTIREKEPQRPSTRLSTMLGDALTTTANAHGSDSVKLLKLIRGDLDWIVMKCLEKDRTRRYDTANGLAADLKRHLNNEPVTARPPSAGYRFQKAFRRNKLVFSAAGAVAGAMLLGVVVSAWQAVRATQASKAESRQRHLAEGAQAEAQTKQWEAEAERNRAETERQRADAQAANAIVSQEHSRLLLYAADMNLAQQALTMNNMGRARRLLDRHRPQPGEKDLRGWEWRYLWQQGRSSALAELVKRPARGLSVSFSPNGAQLAVGYLDGRIELWDVTRRTLLKELNQDGPPGHVAFSPVSNLLATSAGPGVIKLHDLASGGVTDLRIGSPTIRDITFTPDGARLVCFHFGSAGASVLVFDVAQGIALSTNSASHGNAHVGVARLSSDWKRLYLSDRGSHGIGGVSVKCLDVETGREIWTADVGADNGVTAMALSPDDKILVTGTGFEDPTIRVWDAKTGKLVTRLEGHTGWVGEVTFSRDGRWLASAATDHTIRLWETSEWTEARVFRGHGDEVYTVAFSSDGRMLASGSKDGAVLLWDIAARQSPYGYHLLPPELSNLAEYVPGLAIAMVTDAQGLRAGMLRLQDLQESRVPVGSDLNPPFTYLPPDLFGHYDRTNLLRVAEYRDIRMEIFREAVGRNLVLHSDLLHAALAYSRRQRLVAWGETTGAVHVADLDQPARRWHWSSELSRPTPLDFSPDGGLLVLWAQPTPPAMGPDGNPLRPPPRPEERKIEVREALTGRLILHSDIALSYSRSGWLTTYQPRVRFAAAGRRLVAANGRGSDGLQVVFWDLTRPDQPPIRFDERGFPSGLGVSPDGRWVAVGSEAGLVVLYNAVTMERGSVLQGNMQSVHSVAFSPDSRSFATGAGGQEAIKLWQMETGQELLTLPGNGNLLKDIAFAEDGNTLLLGSFGRPGSWQMWRAPSWEIIHAAEAKESPTSDFGEPRQAEGEAMGSVP